MKKLLLLTILVSFVAACHGIRGIPGSGNIQRERRQIAAFNSIETEGAFEIEIVCQKPQSVEIEGDDNVLPLVSTEVSNNVLHIKNNRSYSVKKPVILKISVPDLKSINSSGAGSIEVTDMKNEELEIESNGAPVIRASGETKSLNINANGAGAIETQKLRAGKVVVESNGVSKIEVYATEHLDVTVSGPSTVFYHGGAVVRQTVNGPGSVRKRESEGS